MASLSTSPFHRSGYQARRALVALVALLVIATAVVLATSQARADAPPLPFKVTASPTVNVVNGQSIAINVDGTAASNGGTATSIYEVKAIVCAGSAVVHFDADTWPTATGKCIQHALSPGTSQVELVQPAPGSQQDVDLTYKAGIGADTYSWGPGGANSSTITCDPTHPCQLVVRVSNSSADPISLVSFPVTYWDGVSPTSSSSTSSSSTSSTSSSTTSSTVPPTQTFSDVPTTHPFFADIAWLVAEGVTTGFPDSTYRPTNPLPRQGIAAFLYRYAGEPPYIPPATPSFNDVPLTHPFYKQIEWLKSTGITTGSPDGGFHPLDTITRGSLAALLYRYAGQPTFTPPTTPSFNDVPTSHAFYKHIEWFVSEEVALGFSDGGYHPAANVTRQSIAALLHRFDTNVPH